MKFLSGLLGGGGGSAPAAPDYMALAERTAAGNRVNRITPYGSLQWDGNTVTQALSPELQGMYGRIFSDLPDYNLTRSSVMDAMLARVDDQINIDRDQMRSQLVAQGIPPGSEAWQREMARLDRKHTDARQQAEISATEQAATEAMLPFQALSTFTSGSGMPQYTPTAGPDYLAAGGMQHQAAMNQYNQQQAGRNNLMSGLFGLGSAYLMGAPDDSWIWGKSGYGVNNVRS